MKLSIVILFSLALTALAADITLQWDANDPIDQVIGYSLFQSTNVSGPYLRIGGTEGPKATNYVVRGLVPGVYFFYCTANNIWTNSDPSNVVQTPPLPGAVQSLKIPVPALKLPSGLRAPTPVSNTATKAAKPALPPFPKMR